MSTTVNWQIVHRKVSIAGVVQDSETKEAIADARIEIRSLKQWTLSGADGRFHFMDLSENSYTLNASLPGAGTQYGVAELTTDFTLEAKLLMPPTALKGVLKDADQRAIAGAEVQIQETGDRTWSGKDGAFLLTKLETLKQGSRSLSVTISARGYGQIQQQVAIAQGTTTDLGIKTLVEQSK